MEQRVRQVKEMLYNNEKNLGENTDNKINKPLIKQYNFGNAGQCYVNLLDGTFYHEFNLCTIRSNALKLDINQVFDMKLFNKVSLENNEKFLMRGLKFNFHQHVVKSNTFNEETNSLDTTYIDGKGNYHIFKEKWYYEEDGIKKYIKKDDVYIDNDKKLKFSKNNKIYEVKYEEGKCDNLILINIENTYNYPKVYNPTKQKRYYILLNNGYKKYIFLDENKNLHFPNYFYCSKIEQDVKDFSQKNFLKYENVTVNAQNELKFNGQYVFNIDYIEQNLNSLTKEENNKYSFERKISTSGIVTREYVYIEETCASNENSENIYLNENINNLNAQINQVEEQIKQIKEYIKNYKQQINNCLSNQLFQNYSLKFKELSKEYRNSMEQIQNVSKTNVTINSTTSSSDKNQYYLQLDKYDDLQTFSSLSSISSQRDSLVEEYYKLVDQLNEFNDLKDSLVSYKNSLITEQKNEIGTIIMDTNKNVLYFDYYGRLILIQDIYENSINIEYENKVQSDKIISIYSENEKIIFEYNKTNDLLETIIMPTGNVIKYNNKSNYAVMISRNEQTIELSYSDSIKYFTISDSFSNLLSVRFNNVIERVILEQSHKILNFNGSLINFGERKKLCNHIYQYLQSTTIIENDYNEANQNYRDYIKLHEVYFFNENNDLIIYLNADNKNNDNYFVTYFNADGDILFNNYNENGLLEYQSYVDSNFPPYIEKNSTLNQEIVFSVGSDSNFDLNSILLTNTKVIGILIKRNTQDSISLTVEVNAECNNSNVIKSHHYNNTTLPYIVVPFILPTEKMNFLKVTISSDDLSAKEIEVKILKISNTFYTYDDQKRLILTEDGYNKINYTEFVNGKPTIIIKEDEFERTTKSYINYDINGNVVFTCDWLGFCKRYFYNEKNVLIEELSYPRGNPTLANIEKYKYDEKGNQLYDEEMVPNTSLIQRDDLVTYGYDYFTNQLTEISCVANGVTNFVNYRYNIGLLTKLRNNKMAYEFSYDSLSRIIAIKITGTTKELYSFEYKENVRYNIGEEKHDDFNQFVITDANDNKTEITYDRDGKIYTIEYTKDFLLYEYNEYNQLVSIRKYGAGRSSYLYNQYNQLYSESSDDKLVFYYYDNFRRLKQKEFRFKFGNSNIIYNYVNSFTDILKSVIIDNNVKCARQYNALQQITQEVLTTSGHSINILSNEYFYLQQENKITNLITRQIIKINEKYDDIITCKYDKNGNIIFISSKQNTIYYKYDELNRLIREDNLALDTTTLITYDSCGNILCRKRKSFNINDDDLYKLELEHSYLYSPNGWTDQVIYFDDKEITYDAIGRPVTYDGIALSWNTEGTLESFGNNQYSYNEFNIRISKETEIGTYSFAVENSKILTMSLNDKEIFIFRYFSNKLIGFNYNNNEYFYKRDILGNITHIIDCAGKVVAQYIYDAWGNHKVFDENGKENNDPMALCNLNPFRYKGYFYDVETGLFYCNSRYYSPELCRWLAPDSINYLNLESINGLNLYCYCYNNPIIYADPSGHSVILTIGLLIGSFIVGVGISAISQGFTYGWDEINYWQTMVDGLFTLGSTALAMTGIGALASAGIGAISGWSQYAIDSAFHEEDITLLGSLGSAGLGFISGAISGAGARNSANIASNMELTCKGASAIKAITTASNRYLTGEISLKGYQATIRLWGNIALNSVHNAIAPTIRKLMINGTIKIVASAIISAFATYGLSYYD